MLAITTSTPLPNGATGAIYEQPLIAEGGNPPYTWSITAGQLPPGVTLSSTSGVLNGTPTASGTFTFTVQVTDSGVPTAEGAYNFHGVVSDRVQATAGSEFTLTINSSGSISAVVNGASFLSGPVAPGTIISIFGSEIGPTTAVGLQTDEKDSTSPSVGCVAVTSHRDFRSLQDFGSLSLSRCIC